MDDRWYAPEAVWGRVSDASDAIRQRFRTSWGVRLPESVLRYWAFTLSLGPAEQRAMKHLDLAPFGILDLFENPAAQPRDGLDVRLHGRYYRDPPEFLTFMHGGTDGLHYGLWFDDGQTCTGVASYYNNDGGGVGIPAGTPLEAVREELEETWRARVEDGEDEDEDEVPMGFDPDDLRRVRAMLMAFETGDRPEEGEAYLEAHPRDPSVVGQDERRLMTLDGGGALLPVTTTVTRPAQQGWDDYDWCTATTAELVESPDRVAAMVEQARQRCAGGDPGHALTLGRDLHWISGGEQDRERSARELLVMAYRQLDRPALAGIVEASHRHRRLPDVDVLAGSD